MDIPYHLFSGDSHPAWCLKCLATISDGTTCRPSHQDLGPKVAGWESIPFSGRKWYIYNLYAFMRIFHWYVSLLPKGSQTRSLRTEHAKKNKLSTTQLFFREGGRANTLGFSTLIKLFLILCGNPLDIYVHPSRCLMFDIIHIMSPPWPHATPSPAWV